MSHYSHRIGHSRRTEVKRKPASFSIRQDYLDKLEQVIELKRKQAGWVPSSKSALVEEALGDLFEKYEKGDQV